MKNFIVLALIALCVSSVSAQYSGECLTAVTQYITWSAQCSASLTFDYSNVNSLSAYCGLTSGCGLTQYVTAASNLINQCGGIYGGQARQLMLGTLQLLEGLCTNVNGHLCMQDALTIIDALDGVNFTSAAALAKIQTIITSSCTVGCPDKLLKLALTYGSIFEDMSPAFYGTALLCSTSTGSDNCFLKALTFMNAASATTPDWTTIKGLICDPCIRKFNGFKAYFVGTPFAELFDEIPDFTAVCQTNNESKTCGGIIVDLVSSLGLVSKCTIVPTPQSCYDAVASFITQAGCCTRSILPLLSNKQKAMFLAIPNLPAVCTPPKNQATSLTVTLNLGGVNASRLSTIWNTIKDTVKAEFANQIIFDASDITVDLSVAGGSATIKFTITFTTTVYTPTTLAAIINPMIQSGSLQFSTLNNDASLATSTGGVTVASGSAGGDASSMTVSSMMLGLAVLSIAAL